MRTVKLENPEKIQRIRSGKMTTKEKIIFGFGIFLVPRPQRSWRSRSWLAGKGDSVSRLGCFAEIARVPRLSLVTWWAGSGMNVRRCHPDYDLSLRPLFLG
jgi:hypothetical protein